MAPGTKFARVFLCRDRSAAARRTVSFYRQTDLQTDGRTDRQTDVFNDWLPVGMSIILQNAVIWQQQQQ